MMIRQGFLVAGLLLGGAGAAHADTVTLDTGEVLHGKVADRSGSSVVLDHPVLGRVSMPASRVASVKVDAPESASVTPPVAEAPAAETVPWDSTLEVGISGAEGNSDSFDFRVGAKSERETERDRWRFDTSYTYSESEGEKTKNRFTAGARKDWLFEDSPWLVFGETRYDRDQFAEWDHRGSLAGGAGYRWIREKDLKVGLRAGLSGTKEWGSADDDHVRPEGLFGGEMSWKLSRRMDMEGMTTWYPDLADAPDYRIVSSAAWKLRLDEKDSLSLKIGVEHEYDTHRTDPFKRQDVRYFAVLIYDF